MLAIHVALVPLGRRRPGHWPARARVLLTLFMEAFAESQEMLRAAHRRYPFAE